MLVNQNFALQDLTIHEVTAFVYNDVIQPCLRDEQ